MTRTPSEGFGLEDDRDDLPFQIHHELDDAPLSVWAFRVYAHLVRRSGRDGKIFPSYQTIGEICFRSTYGPTANPKSLRNKAMAAMKELIEVGLVTKVERIRKASLQSDTNTYQLTPRRKWLGELKAKRAELATETEATQKVLRVERIHNRAVKKLTKKQEADKLRAEAEARQKAAKEPQQPPAEPDPQTDPAPPEEGTDLGGGGTPTMPPGIPTVPGGGTPTMSGGIPTVPEVISIEVVQSLEAFTSGGGHSFTGDARAESQIEHHAPSVAVLEAPASTTTDDAALKPQNTQTAPEGLTTVEAGTPDGVIEDALELTDEDAEMLFGSSDENAEDLEQVPGGAAAGRAALSSDLAALPERSGTESVQAATVDLLRGIPEAELLGRPAAIPADPNYKAIVGMVGGKRMIEDGILDGNTPTGGIPRRYWLLLTSEELARIRELAQVEARSTKTSFLTLCILGLDRMIGAPRRAAKDEKQPVLGQAYDSPQAQEERAAELAVQVGSTWVSRKSQKPYLIEEADSRSVFVQGLGEYPLVKFHKLFMAVD